MPRPNQFSVSFRPKLKIKQLTTVFVAAVMACSVFTPYAAANASATVTTPEVKEALTSVSGVLDASDGTATTSDSDSALIASNATSTLDVPKDPSQGVSFGATGGSQLDIELPNQQVLRVMQRQ